MVRVTVEIIPFGQESHKDRKNISVIEIGNLANTKSIEVCNYSITELNEDNSVKKEVKILNHIRKNHVNNLVYKALISLGYDRSIS